MSTKSTSVDDAINQLATVVLALAQTQAAQQPDHTLARLGAAVIASRNQGYGDGYALQIFEQVFPGRPLPVVLSEEELAKKQRELGQ
ncbi:hypothetical protein BWR59_16970 [Pseudomonas sp. Bc-h]|uniref:hypothetical protein n=1 Tax=Pseudomonas sp. Bc-h TaxID=1943632 RepID=UPI0009D99C68|nr:hypothetical protein [Pseudomonas sp. Bc-h]OQR30251.1 hypothetical protein BWR59_16970 [Pseudomonas sp. Bc-h]